MRERWQSRTYSRSCCDLDVVCANLGAPHFPVLLFASDVASGHPVTVP